MARSLACVRWAYGDVVMWCYRRSVMPMRVVEDTDHALVVWQAPQTRYLASVPADGKAFRARPPRERFTCDKVFRVVPWLGDGTLRIATPNAAHSSWLFRSPDLSGEYLGWYGNLEAPLRRSEIGVHTVDHVLDVFMDMHGNVAWKDEDELEAAEQVGRFTADEVAAIRAEGERVYDAMTRRDPPYDGSWLDWKPDPSWTTPDLPPKHAALEGQPANDDLFPSDG
jgi:hypothetical protein